VPARCFFRCARLELSGAAKSVAILVGVVEKVSEAPVASDMSIILTAREQTSASERAGPEEPRGAETGAGRPSSQAPKVHACGDDSGKSEGATEDGDA
jgi:hypothetical protein